MPFDIASREELEHSWKYLDRKGPAPRTAFDVHREIEKGLPAKMLASFRAALTELPDRTWAEILAISVSQLKRLKGAERPLSSGVSSQLVLFAILLTRAEDVFGGRDAALDWMRSEQMALDGQRPIDLLDTFIGAALVDRVLRQIDYGVYL